MLDTNSLILGIAGGLEALGKLPASHSSLTFRRNGGIVSRAPVVFNYYRKCVMGRERTRGLACVEGLGTMAPASKSNALSTGGDL